MKQINLPKMSTSRKPRHINRHFSDENCRNLLAQQFNQPIPNKAWAADFTYVSVNGRFYYICAIMYLFARKIIVCRVSNKLDRFLAIEILRDAVSFRGVSIGIFFHTDRDSQFTSSDFRKEIDRLNMIQSLSAKDHPYYNAVMECFFNYLKKEKLNQSSFQSLEQLQ